LKDESEFVSRKGINGVSEETFDQELNEEESYDSELRSLEILSPSL